MRYLGGYRPLACGNKAGLEIHSNRSRRSHERFPLNVLNVFTDLLTDLSIQFEKPFAHWLIFPHWCEVSAWKFWPRYKITVLNLVQ